MSELTIADFVIPGLMAGLFAAFWALIVLWPTYYVAKRMPFKWLRSIGGMLAFMVVLVGGVVGGGFSWLLYWAGFKQADIERLLSLPPNPSTRDVVLDPEFWAILTPILTPCLVLMVVASKWKKAGASIGADWA